MNHESKKFQKKSAEIYPGAFSRDDLESPLDDNGGYGDPHMRVEDARPDFIIADEEGWMLLQSPYFGRFSNPTSVTSSSTRS